MDLNPMFVCAVPRSLVAGSLMSIFRDSSGTARAVTPWGWLPSAPARHHADRNSTDLIWQFLILQ